MLLPAKTGSMREVSPPMTDTGRGGIELLQALQGIGVVAAGPVEDVGRPFLVI